ncbi:hypothetical protein PIB30_045922 [Stylosanthes scabra]|uniref:Uncharacterized protein n=1 Tax=Stylosanthes scabra TaxID=79078 RepID=A0ABU6XFC8_9FABA|nr:hypothetical protein [Stylosanthes scabra]
MVRTRERVQRWLIVWFLIKSTVEIKGRLPESLHQVSREACQGRISSREIKLLVINISVVVAALEEEQRCAQANVIAMVNTHHVAVVKGNGGSSEEENNVGLSFGPLSIGKKSDHGSFLKLNFSRGGKTTTAPFSSSKNLAPLMGKNGSTSDSSFKDANRQEWS